MKTVILYATKNGVTKSCAEQLQGMFPSGADVTLYQVTQDDHSAAHDAVKAADAVILGGCIRMGKLYRPMRDFVASLSQEETNKTVGCFICCGFSDSWERYMDKAFPETRFPSAVRGYFGGELKPQKLHGLDKWIVRAVRTSIINEGSRPEDRGLEENARSLPEILPESIGLFAAEVKRKLW